MLASALYQKSRIPMYLFRVTLQGYDREKGWGFTLSLDVCGRDPAEARALALEEAVRQGMPVAIVWTVIGGTLAPKDAHPGVLAVSPRAYREEDDPKAGAA
jgi:hypothetical protein